MKKLLALLVVLVTGTGFAAHHLGYLGRWIGQARVEVTPKDSQILGYFPADARGLVGIQVPLARVPGKAGERLRDLARDLEDVSGVRVGFDVDTLVGDADIQVARGRFDWKKMSERLEANGYQITNESYRPLAVRKDGDALAIDDDYLIHGQFEPVKAALDRKSSKTGATAKSRIATDLDAIGWNHAAFGVVRLADEGTSIAQVLKGQEPLRAVGASIDTTDTRYVIVTTVRASSSGSASEIASEAEKMKKTALEELAKNTDPDAARVKAVLESLQIKADGPIVRLGLTVPSELVDRGIDRSQEIRGQLGGAMAGAAMSSLNSVLSSLMKR
ncbi:MAG: hypothetical protein HY791_29680 [Deltaproteobacteria bacterium]|nr:hypothetical protein [Deltaproteobacteria bacterium]